MSTREQLEILQQAVQKAIDFGYLSEKQGPILGVDIVLDPPAVAVASGTYPDDTTLFLDTFFPLFDGEWALAYWGNDLVGDAFYGLLPAWKYHQHKLLELLQNNEKESYYKYIRLFL